MSFLLVALGGALGAMSRYSIFLLGKDKWMIGFPFPTLLVNACGCFLLGIFYSNWPISPKSSLFVFFATGFLGSFTTFSTFGFEIYEMISKNRLDLALGYVLTSLMLGIALIWTGHMVKI